ncbi:DUF4956 domain-containing protein [Bacteroidia bacterium]|nr:DUF4956 domain-containing protein [Bacteroidia bacterium]
MILTKIQTDLEIAAEHAKALAENGASFMGKDVFDSTTLLQLLIHFSAHLLVCWIIIHFLYYKKSTRKDYYFTFILFSITIFLLLFILQSISMQFGFALGLFCIFGMIRYRTESIQVRDMTYLFSIIGISAINGLAIDVDYVTLIVTNIMFIAIIWVLESNIKQAPSKIILYEKIGLIRPDKKKELIADLKERTGLDITSVEVGHIDFLRDVAFLKITYNASVDDINTIGNLTRFS